eukprot:4769102-Amphidinium_carterae.1
MSCVQTLIKCNQHTWESISRSWDLSLIPVGSPTVKGPKTLGSCVLPIVITISGAYVVCDNMHVHAHALPFFVAVWLLQGWAGGPHFAFHPAVAGQPSRSYRLTFAMCAGAFSRWKVAFSGSGECWSTARQDVAIDDVEGSIFTLGGTNEGSAVGAGSCAIFF